MSSKRRQILEAFMALGDNIRKLDGYNNTIDNNYKTYVDISQVPPGNFPVLTYLTGPSAYSPLTTLEYTSGSSPTSMDGWAITIIGYFEIDTETDNPEASLLLAAEDLIEDILKKWLANHNLGLTFVQGIFLDSVETAWHQALENRGIVYINFFVKYDFGRSAP